MTKKEAEYKIVLPELKFEISIPAQTIGGKEKIGTLTSTIKDAILKAVARDFLEVGQKTLLEKVEATTVRVEIEDQMFSCDLECSSESWYPAPIKIPDINRQKVMRIAKGVIKSKRKASPYYKDTKLPSPDSRKEYP